jgi:hypothetical protein
MQGNLLNNLMTLPSTFYENAPVQWPALPADALPHQGGAPLQEAAVVVVELH